MSELKPVPVLWLARAGNRQQRNAGRRDRVQLANIQAMCLGAIKGHESRAGCRDTLLVAATVARAALARCREGRED